MISEIRWVDINEIKPNKKNRNSHPEEQIQRLAEIIKFQGFRIPLVVSNRSGTLVSGHGRLLAAKALKLKSVPVSFQDFESEEQEYAAGVSDNAIASWAELDLSGINFDVPNLGPDFNIEMLGIKDFEIEPADKYGDEDADECPEVRQTSIVLGDYFQLGEHRLLCGDATNKLSVEKLMNGEKANMVFTDPPYGVSVVKPDGKIGGDRIRWKDAKADTGVYRPVIGDDVPFEPSMLLLLAEQHIIWGANNFASKLPDNSHWIVWYKDMPEGTDFGGCELAWTSIKNRKSVKTYKHTWAGMTREGSRKDELSKRVHPTQKPVGLFEKILNDYAPASVIDLYLGSGSTLIACEKTNRKCYGMEIDPVYCQTIIDRWERFTGQKAVKI